MILRKVHKKKLVYPVVPYIFSVSFILKSLMENFMLWSPVILVSINTRDEREPLTG